MNSDGSSAFSYVLELLLSPLEEPFRRYLDICEDVHMRDASRNTMLHWAATVGNVAAAYALLQHGVEVDARNVYGATPLHLAAAFAPNMGVMGPLLMQHGASLTVPLSSRNETGVGSLLASRGLKAVWTWMVELSALLQQNGDSSPLLFRFGGSSSLPSAASIRAVTPLLCAPEELQQLGQGRGSSMQRPCAAVGMRAVPIPRAPARRLTPHGGGGHLLSQKRSARLVSSHAAAAESASSATAASAASLRSATAEREAAVALFVSREEVGRIQLEKEQVEARLEIHVELCDPLWSPYTCDEGDEVDVDSKMPASSAWWGTAGGVGNPEGDDTYAGLVGLVVAVLGEKFDMKDGRQLFVQYKEPAGVDGAHVAEVWCPFSSVAHDPVVVAYIDRYSRTYGLTNSVSVKAAATPSILNSNGGCGSPLDSMEREQLEEQLRMLPRRDLSSPESAVSLNVSTKQFIPIAASELKSPEEFYSVRDELTPPVSRSPNPATLAGGLALRHPHPRRDEKDGDGWHFAQAHMQEISPVQGVWPATGPAVSPEQTPTQTDAEAAQDTTASAVANHAPTGVRSQPSRDDACVHLRQHSSPDVNRAVSGASSTVHTQPQVSSLRDGTSVILEKDERYHLSETQKARYNSFLRDSALQRLHKRQGRLFAGASGG
ncbi:conserved hypothetical protein [Leishmania major strain Friedlin]|uniref:Uncharacterized protein n=1 Tax=Leishmania major TaxID=5664 RepID=Q4Q5G4_LEIMA|nr:conserved hypothetical protein [Leishmania major strain Friedlin]CAG9580165.1 Ankyrin_repeats_(3_copies)/Ankyrin_repeats_(many_copies)/Ankyrin_repeat_-_putative [Leishmania major strain Friedlin]CAJ08638.1 conserved hypothetical protein [Leishmania major strain Friedlin]|eukprot:XP_001685434.1 conserved hypothetical protein [Leishmania major strain Friedlin]